MIRKRRSFMTALATRPLTEARDRARMEARTAQEAFRDSTVSRVLTETADTGNFILKAAIWVTFSAIFLETFSMEATAFMEGEARAREAAFIRAASEISAAGRRARI